MPFMDLSAHPDVREAIAASPYWHEVQHLDVVDSTQNEALRQLRGGAAAGLVVVADAQTAGRGRLGRPWKDTVTSVSGPANLAVTATARSAGDSSDQLLPVLPLAVGIALARAIDRLGVSSSLKWPNDVLLGPGKAAGILIERHTLPAAPSGGGVGGDLTTGTVVLVGCGINVDWRGVERDQLSGSAWSIAEERGGDVDRGVVLAHLLTELTAIWAADISTVLAEYRRRCATLGRDVRVERPGKGPLYGRAIDLDGQGRLVVRPRSGSDEIIDVGDVIHVRAAKTPGP